MIPGKEDFAIYRSNSNGPIFGGGHDLKIANSPNSNNCSSKLNHTYQLPAGQKATTFLTGNENFTSSEMEVFMFEK